MEGDFKEINFTLTGLRAPTLGKKTQAGVVADQPYSWESREFLRKLLIGKPVVYKIEHELEGGVRAYGDLWLNTENVREKIISNGWAEVSVKERKPALGQDGKELPPRELRSDEAELIRLQEEAKKLKKGMWKNAPTSQPALKTIRKIKYHDAATRRDEADASVALFNFFERSRGQALNGVVEQVRSGSSLRVYFPSTQDEVTVNLSGVLAPVFRFGDEASSQPYAREAKFYTDAKLLHRDVSVTLETLDKTNNLFGTVLDADQQRNIAGHLLQQGLATFVEWNCPVEKAKEFQDLEEKAKTSRARIWAKPAPKPATSTTTAPAQVSAGTIFDDQFTGTVVEIISPGSIVVRVPKADGSSVDVTTFFSSIRAPRLPLPSKKKDEGEGDKAEDEEDVTPVVAATSVVGNKGGKDAKLTTQEVERIEGAYAREAKDFLRKELIGKKVSCVKDYVDEGPKKQNAAKTGKKQPARPPRVMYSVYLGKSNVALKLLRKGYAKASFLSESDPRSADYREMVLAEKAAEKDKVGLHAPHSKAPVVLVNDLAFEGEARCRHFLGSLQRIGRVPAVVEYNFGPGRFKIYIPSQGLSISFALKGVISEKSVKVKLPEGVPANFRKLHPIKDEEGNIIHANVALQYTRDTLFQRDVSITVEDIDAQGTFFGSLFLGNESFAQKLVELGYARLHMGSASRLPNFDALKKAEEKAQAAKKGIWWNFDPEVEAAAKLEREAAREASRQAARAAYSNENTKVVASKKFLVTITEIMTGSNFFFQIADEETKTFMEDLMEDFQNRGWQDKEPYYPQKKGEWVAGQFTVDNTWYRAQVLRIIPGATEREEKTYELRYLDYGNSEIVTKKNIRQLDDEFQKTPAQAHKGKVAYIKAPHLDAEFGDDAAIYFKELVWGKTLQANLQYQEEGVYHVTLGDEDGQVDIGGALVIEGLASLEPKYKTPNAKYYTELQKQEETARSARLRIWQYGALPDSDDEAQWHR